MIIRLLLLHVRLLPLHKSVVQQEVESKLEQGDNESAYPHPRIVTPSLSAFKQTLAPITQVSIKLVHGVLFSSRQV